MNKKINCWEFMKCGKGPRGNRADKEGVCPIAKETMADGLNGGENGGRICWIIAENCCLEDVKCSEFHRGTSCFSCEFRYKVTMEEGLLNVCQTTGVLIASSGVLQKE